MRPHPPIRLRLLVWMLLPALTSLFGCVTSEKTAYERHLNGIVSQGPAASDDLAAAFGLDDYARRTLARRR